jgi:membrane-associated protease RseP (regulator of RpoE activity)
MRTFPAIAAALLLASGAVVAATMTDDPGQAAKSSPKVRVEVSPDGDRVEAIVNGVVDDEQGERVRRLAVLGGRGGHLGVSVKDVDPSVQGRSGAIVEEVREGSAAEKAGIRAGDVIAEFDGERVRGVRHLTRLVSETPEGRSVKAVVERDGKRVELTVTPESSRRCASSGCRVSRKSCDASSSGRFRARARGRSGAVRARCSGSG